MLRRWAGLVFLCSAAVFGKASPAVSSAAEYYYRLHDFQQALPLWEAALARDPDNAVALMRVGEMLLWTEGRAALADRFRPAIEKRDQVPATRIALKDKLRELQTTFLTDRAQILFLQGRHRASRGDLKGAWDCLSQASDLDRGQFSILSDRARLEKGLGLFDQYYQSLRLAVKSYPYDDATLTALAEAHLAFQNPKGTLETLQAVDAAPDPSRKTLLAVAMADAGDGVQALPLLRSLAGFKAGRCAVPVACHALARVLSNTPGSEAESRRWFERFVASVPGETASTAWDPYRLPERLADARKQLARVP